MVMTSATAGDTTQRAAETLRQSARQVLPFVRMVVGALETNRLGYAVAAFLGVNAWAQLVLATALFCPAIEMGVALMVAAPLVALAAGIRWRNDWLLLLAVPTAMAAALVTMRDALDLAHFPRLRLLLASCSLVVYLLAAAWVASAAPPAQPSVRMATLPAHTRPARWASRERMYWGLAAVALLFPSALLHHILYDAAFLERVSSLYGDRQRGMQILLMLGGLVVWLAMARWAVIDVLDRHRSGDRVLAVELERLRQRRRLRPGFVLAIAAGLAAVIAVSVLRSAP